VFLGKTKSEGKIIFSRMVSDCLKITLDLVAFFKFEQLLLESKIESAIDARWRVAKSYQF